MDEDVRLREPNRQQLIMQTLDYEALIGAEHPARAIWRVLEGLDLSRFSAPLRARANGGTRRDGSAGAAGAVAVRVERRGE